jgi:cytochrome P450
MHRNKEIFSDSLAFKPERWIDADPEQLKLMHQHFVPFIIEPCACLSRW